VPLRTSVPCFLWVPITMSAPESTAHSSAEWDEAQCIASLAQLERLQEQVGQHTHSLREL
jgi:hypothetical protein